jgi:peptide/nickel transport system permease protein
MSAELNKATSAPTSIRRQNSQRAFYRFRTAPLSIPALAVVMLLLFAAAFGPLVAPFEQDIYGAIDTGSRFMAPSLTHWFGTNDLGQDVLSLVLGGARITLGAAFTVVFLGAVIGTLAGACAGYFGGFVDNVIMRSTDLMLILPSLILAMLIGAALGAGLNNLVLALVVSWWPSYCRLVRGEVLSKKEELYIVATRALGARDSRIILKHILPNISQVLIVRMSTDIGNAILMVAALSFIGIGVKPPTPEWGLLLSLARTNLPDIWWTAAFPGMAIFLAVFSISIVGDALRGALDPKSTRF